MADFHNEAIASLVEAARYRDGSAIPNILEDVLNIRAWEHETDKEGRPFTSFIHMLEYEIPYGMGYDHMTFIRKFIPPGETDTDRLIVRMAMELPPLGSHGTNRYSRADSVSSKISHGNSLVYAAQKLLRDDPEMAEKVLENKDSIPRRPQRKTKTIREQLEALWKKATPADRKWFKENHMKKEVT